MSSAADLLRKATSRLRATGIERPRAEAVILLRHASGASREALLATPAMTIEDDNALRFEEFVRRRTVGEPMALIRGEVEFWGRSLALEPGVLTARADTETLIEAALEVLEPDASPLILDIGSGSGAIAVTLLAERPRARAVATDTSAVALNVTRRNAIRHGVADRLHLVRTCWAEALAGPFDLVASNPPYIESAAIAGLQVEVRAFEPLQALDGGADGLDAYRAIIADLPRLLARDGRTILEIGSGQANAVGTIAAGFGFAAEVRKDLAGLDRVLGLRRV